MLLERISDGAFVTANKLQIFAIQIKSYLQI